MVCFDIVLAYPLPKREYGRRVYESFFEHLRRQCLADTVSEEIVNGVRYLRVRVCDESAVAFLRDVPKPTYCVDIYILHNESLLYSNHKVTKKWVSPPREQILKQVYWTANKLEKWQV